MKTTFPIHFVQQPRTIGLVCGLISAWVGVFVLIGWAAGNDAMKTVFPGLVTMKANTALGLLLCGAATALLSLRKNGPLALCAGLLAITTLVLGLLTLGQYFFKWELGIDQLLFVDPGDVIGTSGPGRMAPSTAFCFVVTGTALAMASQPVFSKWRSPVLAAIGLTVLLIGGAGTIGQLTNGLVHWTFWNFSGMAIHTALGFVFLGMGMFALITEEQTIFWALDPQTTVGFLMAVVTMLAVAGYTWNYTFRLNAAASLVGRSNDDLRQIENIRAAMSGLESGQRGYVITGDESLLAPRDELHATVQQEITALRRSTAGDAARQGQLDELAQTALARAAFGNHTIDLRRREGFPAAQAFIASGAGIAMTDKINGLLNAMRETEYDRFLNREEDAEAAATSTLLLLPTGIFLSLAILSLALFFLNAGLGEEKIMREKLGASLKEIGYLKYALDEHSIVAFTDPQGKITYVNDKFCEISKYSRAELLGQDHRIINSGFHGKEFIRDLWTTIAGGQVWHGEIKNRAKDGAFYWVDTTIVPFLNDEGKPRQYVAIRTDITMRKAAEEEIRELNASLEKRVADRTAELEIANKELEAFSYSVSHDLRSPLRAIDGFSQAVLEDCASCLPEQGRKDLDTIRAAAQRMGHLIDDLLAFSRLGRTQVRKREVDVSRIVENVLAELAPQHADRKVEIMLKKLPSCLGDPALLKQVWINLLSNAIKYTSKCPSAVIEIGSRAEGSRIVYFVRDNGAGFDMRYAQKLFGVFQRLHRLDEFEGTGVGLAIVQRIIQRHGGTIWADAKPNYGATFHFTLTGEKDHD